jgi:PRA1 family protein 3
MILGVFVHSSLRLRNMKNKLTTAVEQVGIKHSPMGQVLEAVGLMPDTFQ